MASITRPRKTPSGPTATEARIRQAVLTLLESGESFTELSVERILAEAGVARATFYAHFKDKTELIVRVTGELRQRLLELARQWDPGAGEDGAERYTRFFAEVLAIHRANAKVLAALREVAGYDRTIRGFHSADLEEFDEAVLRTAEEQQRLGATPEDVAAVAASRVIVWGGGAAIARHIEVDDGSGDAAFARELGRIWWHGVYRRPAETPPQEQES